MISNCSGKFEHAMTVFVVLKKFGAFFLQKSQSQEIRFYFLKTLIDLWQYVTYYTLSTPGID